MISPDVPPPVDWTVSPMDHSGPPDEPGDWIAFAEILTHLSISSDDWNSWERKGLVPAYVLRVDDDALVLLADYEQWIESSRPGSTPAPTAKTTNPTSQNKRPRRKRRSSNTGGAAPMKEHTPS
ncbi:hypothetical protein [Acrocarpospora sp. B8E8]|uniref:hypothetical protein n=1 Tax=Acrocarpospora sp. B8E8 TaxID=3153572 RepID=UPI00325ECE72